MKIKYGDTSVIKIKKMKLKLGTAVFLKENENYDPRLRSLVKGKHRFVIIAHAGKKSPCVAVGLLSTSKYMNEELEFGIKLMGDYGEYGNGKDVYMDSNNIWLIRTDSIEKVAYQLADQDVVRVTSNFLSSRINVTVRPSIKDSGFIKMFISDFQLYFDIKAHNDVEQRDLDTRIIASSIPDEVVEQFAEKLRDKSQWKSEESRLQCINAIEEYKMETGGTELDFYKQMLAEFGLSKKQKRDVAENIRKGYGNMKEVSFCLENYDGYDEEDEYERFLEA